MKEIKCMLTYRARLINCFRRQRIAEPAKRAKVRKKEKGDRANFTGWSKLNKCGLQLGAYSIAVEETLGLHIDAAQILVSTPEIDQCFTFQGDELERFKTRWLQRVRKYRDLKECFTIFALAFIISYR